MFRGFRNRPYELALTVLVAVVSLFYSGKRAADLSFTHDESHTYNVYVQKDFMGIVNYERPILPNNHILNTLAIKYTEKVMGSSKFALRFPNLLFHLVFILSAALICLRSKDFWLFAFAFILLNANPYLLDYFGLARGYGMGASLMMLSLFYFLLHLRSPCIKRLYAALIIGAFAVLANFTLLNYYLGVLGAYNLWLAGTLSGNWVKPWLRANIPPAVVTAILAGILYEPFRKMNIHLFGGESGFWRDTAGTLLERSFYGEHPTWVTPALIFVEILFVGALLYVVWRFWREKREALKNPALLAFVVLFLAGLSTVLQHLLLGNQYLEYRTGLFFIPLFWLGIVLLLFELAEKWKPPVSVSLGVLATFWLIFTLSKANFQFVLDWKYEQNTEEVAEILQEQWKASGKERLRVGVNWLYEPTLNFYRQTKEFTWLDSLTRLGVAGDYDLWYLQNTDQDSLPKFEGEAIQPFPASASILYKKSSYLER